MSQNQKQLGYGWQKNEYDEEFIAVLNHLGLFQPESTYKVICPFHGDINPSMLINLETSSFKCFGCEISGGKMEMMRTKYPNLSDFKLMQKIKRLKLGKDVAQLSKNITVYEKKGKNINAARDYYFNLSSVNWFRKFDTDEEEIKLYLRKRGFKMSMLNKVGVKINQSVNYPIIVPIRDNGVFRGYVMRTISKEIEKKKKYLYNAGFCRRNTLAGKYDNETVLLVEGFFDMLKAVQYGVKFVAAILGWKISEKQIQKLMKKGVKTIICGTDRDKAGRKGYVYLKSLKQFNVERLRYPKGIKDFGDVTDEVFENCIGLQLKQYGLI